MSGFTLAGAGGGGPSACASDVVAGNVEIATLLETLDGTTYAGGGPSGCPLAVNPTRLILKEETATGGKYWDFPSGTAVTTGFGTDAIDLSSERSAASQFVSGNQSIGIGTRNTVPGNTSIAIGRLCVGSGILGLDHDDQIMIGNGAVTNYEGAIAIGSAANAISDGVAVGTNAVAGTNCVAIGFDSDCVFGPSIAIGFGSKNEGVNNITMGFGTAAPVTVDRIVVIGHNAYANSDNGVAIGYTARADGLINSIAVGTYALADGDNASAFGYRADANGDDSISVGRSNFSEGINSVAVGTLVNVATPGNLNDATGAIAGDPQAPGTVGTNSIAVGIAANAQALRSQALGFKAVNRVIDTTNLAGAIIIRKDDGEPLSEAVRSFAGAEVAIMTDEIDLTAVADHTITLPAGCHFFIKEVQIVLTEITGLLTTQPTVRVGITGTPAKYVAAVITTLLTTTFKREQFVTLLEDDGETSLLFGVTVGATVATSMSGRAVFKGILVEDE